MNLAYDALLVHSPHWSSTLTKTITTFFPDRSLLFSLPAHDIIPFFPPSRWREVFFAWRNLANPEHMLEKLTEQNITPIGFDDARYPHLLREIHQPPLVLFAQGTFPSVQHSWCAIVGSRNATAYGTSNAQTFASECVKRDWGIISGLARGIDDAALRSAIAAKGNVLAVLAGGHGASSGRERELLLHVTAHGGAVITEHPYHVQPASYSFPIRNRIVAGIAERILVVEAAEESGSMSTALWGMKENRSVFTIPGLISNPASTGCHKLLRDGAGLCTSIYDLLELPTPDPEPERTDGVSERKDGAFAGDVSANAPSQQPTPHPLNPTPLLTTPLHTQIWDALATPQHFDALCARTGACSAEVAGILTIWEIEGYVSISEALYYMRTL